MSVYVVLPIKQIPRILGVFTTARKAAICREQCQREGIPCKVVKVDTNKRNHDHD